MIRTTKKFLLLTLMVVAGTLYAQKPWTFLVYMAADNNLNPYATLDLKEMAQIGSNENVNICVYLTIKPLGKPKVTQKIYIEKDKIIVKEEVPGKDSGATATLQEALVWAHNEYPSDHMAVVLWNHGSGPLNRSEAGILSNRGICYDDSTGNFLTDRNLITAFRYFCEHYKEGQKIDVFACDACLMAHVEVAYASALFADFFVASQETIPGEGYGYNRALRIFRKNNPDAETFARHLVTAYGNTYGTDANASYNDYTLSAMNLSYAPQLANNISRLGRLLRAALKSDTTGNRKAIIDSCLSSDICTHFTVGYYIDLYQFCSNLLKKAGSLGLSSTGYSALTNTLNTGMRLIRSCVLTNVHSPNKNGVGGLSIYFANSIVDDSYLSLYWTEHTDWALFLQEYLSH